MARAIPRIDFGNLIQQELSSSYKGGATFGTPLPLDRSRISAGRHCGGKFPGDYAGASATSRQGDDRLVCLLAPKQRSVTEVPSDPVRGERSDRNGSSWSLGSSIDPDARKRATGRPVARRWSKPARTSSASPGGRRDPRTRLQTISISASFWLL